MEDYLFVTGASQNIKHSELDKNMAILEAYKYFLANYQPSQKDLIDNYELTYSTEIGRILKEWEDSENKNI